MTHLWSTAVLTLAIALAGPTFAQATCDPNDPNPEEPDCCVPSVLDPNDRGLDECAPEVEFSTPTAQSLKDKAATLGSPLAIYNYVRDEYEFRLYHGSRSSSVNTFEGIAGNDVDLASLLIALLRSQSIPTPALYAVGVIQMPTVDLMNWIGAETGTLAATLMSRQGMPLAGCVDSAGVSQPVEACVELEGSAVQFECSAPVET